MFAVVVVVVGHVIKIMIIFIQCNSDEGEEERNDDDPIVVELVKFGLVASLFAA